MNNEQTIAVKQDILLPCYWPMLYIFIKSQLYRFFIGHLGIAVLLVITPFIVYSQEGKSFDEVSILLQAPRIGNFEIPAIIQNDVAYLHVKEFFDVLKIKNICSSKLDSISGYFIDSKEKFLFDKKSNHIVYQGKTSSLLLSDMILTENGLYVRSDYFGIFGLGCIFNFRNLSIKLDTQLDLPLFREMRQELLRRNIKALKGEVKADSQILRRNTWFRLGIADWAVTATQRENKQNEATLNLRLGAMIAGGEVTTSFIFDNRKLFKASEQYYQWRYVNNNFKPLRQIIIGNIPTQATSTISAPVRGVQLSNAPTTYNKSFGTYTLSNRTEPGWVVELYVNNVLVEYVIADASGYYSFQVPLIFGNSMVKFRFYGPSGEEKQTEQFVSIPFSFMPKNVFEYTIRAGVVDDIKDSRFARGQFNYGLGNKITVGGGIEYLSSLNGYKSMPFVNSSIRILPNLLFSQDLTFRVKSKSILSYQRPSNFQAELNYTRYVKGQQAINNNFLEERKATVYMPWRVNKVSMASRFTIKQFISSLESDSTLLVTKYNKIEKRKNTAVELLLSATRFRLSANLTTRADFTKATIPDIYSNLALSYRLKSGLVLRPQAMFNYSQSGFATMKIELEKRILHRFYANFSYEKNYPAKSSSVSVGFRYDLSFAKTSFTVNRSNKNITTVQSANGSLLYDSKTDFIHFQNRPGVGRGGITLVPFLDKNCNGKREANEPNITGLKYRINGGRKVINEDEAIQRVVDLEAYRTYLLEIDGNSFGNIAWQVKNKKISIVIDPNQMKMVEIPVAVLGEASGMVYFDNGIERKGLARMLVNFYDSSSKQVGQTLTESDGYFSYMSLAPGSYVIRMDTAQLHKLNFISVPGTFSFVIGDSEEGVVMDGFEFTIKSISDTVHQGIIPRNRQAVSENKEKPVIEENLTSSISAASEPVLDSMPLPVTKKKPGIGTISKQQPAIPKGYIVKKKLQASKNIAVTIQKKKITVVSARQQQGIKKLQPVIKIPDPRTHKSYEKNSKNKQKVLSQQLKEKSEKKPVILHHQKNKNSGNRQKKDSQKPLSNGQQIFIYNIQRLLDALKLLIRQGWEMLQGMQKPGL